MKKIENSPALLTAISAALTLPMLLASARVLAQTPPKPLTLLEIKPGSDKKLTPSSAQIKMDSNSSSDPSIEVTVQPGADAHPGILLKPTKGVWDLSHYGHVEAEVRNVCKDPITISLRVENAGSAATNP